MASSPIQTARRSYSAQVNYGDGSPAETLTLNPTSADRGVTGTFALSHTYADNGSYTIVITMTDNGDNVGVSNHVVTIQNLAPVVA